MQIPILRRSPAPLGRILPTHIVGLVHQGDIEAPRRIEFSPAVSACHQAGGNNHQVRLIERRGGALLFKGEQIGMALAGTAQSPPEGEQEFARHLPLPLACQAGRGADQYPPDETGQVERTHGQPCLNGLAESHFIAQQIAIGPGIDQSPGHDCLVWPGDN